MKCYNTFYLHISLLLSKNFLPKKCRTKNFSEIHIIRLVLISVNNFIFLKYFYLTSTLFNYLVP